MVQMQVLRREICCHVDDEEVGPVKDSFVKFAIRARTNTLATDKFKQIMERRPQL